MSIFSALFHFNVLYTKGQNHSIVLKIFFGYLLHARRWTEKSKQKWRLYNGSCSPKIYSILRWQCQDLITHTDI